MNTQDHLNSSIPGAESRFIPRGENQLHAFEAGSGSDVLMLHGNPTWSFAFHRLFPLLAPNFRLHALDHMGCGRSSRPAKDAYPYTLEARVADLEAFIEASEMRQPFHLIVHDWGGMIGFGYAVKHPNAIRSLTVCNTAAFPNPKGRKLPPSIRICRTPGLGHLLIQSPINAFCRGLMHSGTERAIPPGVQRAYTDPYRTWSDRLAIKRFIDDIPLDADHPSMATVRATAEGLERLKRIPMLLFWGAQDFVFDDAFLAEWQRRFPNAESRYLKDCGHLVLEDAEAEDLDAIRAFLLRNEPSQPELHS